MVWLQASFLQPWYPQCLAHSRHPQYVWWMKKWVSVHSPLQQTQHLVFYPSQMFGFSIDPKESITTQGYSVRVECYLDLTSILQDEGKVTARRGAFHTIVSAERYMKSCLWGDVLPNTVVVPGFKSQFCYYLLMWPWASDLPFLGLNFSILKMAIIHMSTTSKDYSNV